MLLVLAVAVAVPRLTSRMDGGGSDQDRTTAPARTAPAATDGGSLTEFVTFVVNDVQRTWSREFARAGSQYQATTLVLFDGATGSGCGIASSDTGPFYCPVDRRVYLDADFFRDLATRFGAPGDFAQAYVIAHELGHHVQNLLGVHAQVASARAANPYQANALSVRVELQADCLAGVWAHSTSVRGLLEPGDLEEGLTAAAAVGDDRIEAATTGRIDPETFTHGTSEQRTTWFGRGFDGGDIDSCDTFSATV